MPLTSFGSTGFIGPSPGRDLRNSRPTSSPDRFAADIILDARHRLLRREFVLPEGRSWRPSLPCGLLPSWRPSTWQARVEELPGQRIPQHFPFSVHHPEHRRLRRLAQLVLRQRSSIFASGFVVAHVGIVPSRGQVGLFGRRPRTDPEVSHPPEDDPSMQPGIRDRVELRHARSSSIALRMRRTRRSWPCAST